MKPLATLAALMLAIAGAPALSQGEELSGDSALACEAILCLSVPAAPAACAPSLARYFGISFRLAIDTIRGRINFLKLCPSVDGGGDLAALVEAIGNGAGYCTAEALNNAVASVDVQDCPANPWEFGSGDAGELVTRTVIGPAPKGVPLSMQLVDYSNAPNYRNPDGDRCVYRTLPVVAPEMPPYCVAYTRNPLTSGLSLHYEGHPLTGGQWVADQ